MAPLKEPKLAETSSILFDQDGVTVSSQPALKPTKKSASNKSGGSTSREHHEDDDLGTILTLTMNRGQNLFNNEMVSLLNAALDIVQEQPHPKALIVTSHDAKFFSNGLDLKALQSSSVQDFIQGVWRFLGRLLILDCRTIAAINGHAFGAGLFLALACDARIMRTKRGFLNWPEVNLGMRLAKGFAELTKAKVAAVVALPQTQNQQQEQQYHHHIWRDGVLGGQRYTSSMALQCGLVDCQVPIEQLMDCAKALATAWLAKQAQFANFDPYAFSQMKQELYTDAYRALTKGTGQDPPHSRL